MSNAGDTGNSLPPSSAGRASTGAGQNTTTNNGQNPAAQRADLRLLNDLLQQTPLPLNKAAQSTLSQSGLLNAILNNGTPPTVTLYGANNQALGNVSLSVNSQIKPEQLANMVQRLAGQTLELTISRDNQMVQTIRLQNTPPPMSKANQPAQTMAQNAPLPAALQLSQFPASQIQNLSLSNIASGAQTIIAVPLLASASPSPASGVAFPPQNMIWPSDSRTPAPSTQISSQASPQNAPIIGTADWPKSVRETPVYRLQITPQTNSPNSSNAPPTSSNTTNAASGGQNTVANPSPVQSAVVTGHIGAQNLPVITLQFKGSSGQNTASFVLLTQSNLPVGTRVNLQFMPPPSVNSAMPQGSALSSGGANAPVQTISQGLQQARLVSSATAATATPTSTQAETQIRQTLPLPFIPPLVNPAAASIAPASGATQPIPPNSLTLPSSLLFILSALKMADFSGWAGHSATQAMQQKLGHEQMKRLENSFRELVKTGTDANGQKWRIHTVPLNVPHDPQQPIQAIEIITRDHSQPSRDHDDQDPNKENTTRFMLNLDLSQIGAIQIDGLLHEKRLDIVLRVERDLDSALQAELSNSFADVIDGLGMVGGLSFRTVSRQDPQWHHIWLDDDLTAQDHHGDILA